MNKKIIFIIVLLGFILFYSYYYLFVEEAKSIIDNSGSQLYLQEKDNYYFYLKNSRVINSSFKQIIGVGINSPQKELCVFDIALRDVINKNNTIFYPKKNIIDAKTIYGKPFKIGFKITPFAENKELIFDLKNVPAVDLSDPGSCCGGCDFSCGGGCSVEFNYTTETKLKPNDWLEIKYDIINIEDTSDKRSIYTIKISLKNKKLENINYKISIPVKLNNKPVTLLSYPDELNMKRKNNKIVLEGTLTNKIDIIIKLKSDTFMKNTTIPRFLWITGTYPKLVNFPIQVDTKRKINRIIETNFNFICHLEIK